MSTQTATPPRSKTIVHRARKTHKTLKTAVPVITTFVSMLGAIVVAMEAFTGNKDTAPRHKSRHVSWSKSGDGDEEWDEDEDEEDEDFEDEEDEVRGYSFFAHMMTIGHYLLKTAILIVFAALVVVLVTSGGQTVAAVTITVLILSALWLTATVSRRS